MRTWNRGFYAMRLKSAFGKCRTALVLAVALVIVIEKACQAEDEHEHDDE
jgi:hypothetical protein